jgi:hypothetical protein
MAKVNIPAGAGLQSLPARDNAGRIFNRPRSNPAIDGGPFPAKKEIQGVPV